MTNTQEQTMQGLEVKIPPPIVAVLFAASLWLAARLLPVVTLPFSVRITLVSLSSVVGFTFALLGMLTFRRAKTTINPVNPEEASTIVSSGIYRFTRNPMYVGLAAALVSFALWLSVPWLLLGPVAFVLFITRFQIMPEESVLSSKFGSEYDQYRRRVRRWL
jgi:protein-S-isoprenylcysteine O-methyltransferase Ste14